MGFINVNGQQVHTSSINTNVVYSGSGTVSNNTSISILNTGTSSIYTTSTNNTFAIYSQKAKYIILGEEFEMDGYQDSTIAIIISSINIMGKPFYDDLKKQNVHLPGEIEEFLEQRFIILERDKKIEDIITR
jgi:hypothetical protein